VTEVRDQERATSPSVAQRDAASNSLRETAIDVLSRNSRNGYVAPARGLYVHQHLWDSCFTAIGQRHYDVHGAIGALRRLLAAQWGNGMVPKIRFERGARYWWDRQVWRSWVNPSAPRGVATAGISQPPMIAEAVVRVGEVLPPGEKLEWYRSVFDPLVSYHEWLHFDRGADGSGLSVQIHPWETGLDDSPPLVELLGAVPSPWWLDLMARSGADRIATHLRWDTKYVAADQRSSTLEALRLYAELARIRRRRYDSAAVLGRRSFAVQDLTFNSILARANTLLCEIAGEIGSPLPDRLVSAIRVQGDAMEELWDADVGSYFSRDPRTRELVKVPSIAAFMPLYAGCVDGVRAKYLVNRLSDPGTFATPCPVPTVPIDSPWFQAWRYWQGPTWVNMNWFIIDGLRRYGFDEEADTLRLRTLALAVESGFYEYYQPFTGAPAGAKDFSWTAALIVDLLSDERRSVSEASE
jgi:hypothetical protein